MRRVKRRNNCRPRKSSSSRTWRLIAPCVRCNSAAASVKDRWRAAASKPGSVERVADRLEKQGHKVFAPTLTGLGERAHLISAQVDINTHITDIVNLIKFESLDDIV